MRILSFVLMLVLALAVVFPASAQSLNFTTITAVDDDNGDDDNGDADDCCPGCSYIAGIDATFMRYHRSDGVGNEFDFDFAPRVTLGYVACDGLGIRVRYWDMEADNNNGASIDTFTLDTELFQEYDLGCYTSLEVSAGIRYNEWTEEGLRNTDTFTGFGGIVGIEVTRSVAVGGSLYARLRQSIMMDDFSSSGWWTDNDNGSSRLDTTRNITEIGLGWQTSCCLCDGAELTVHVGVEWQNWANYAESHTIGVSGVDYDGVSTEDAGFGGFVIGGSYQY